MKPQKPLRSDMGWSSRRPYRRARPRSRRRADLGQIDLGDMAFLEITGRRPTAPEAEVFNALLVTLVEHGMTPQAIATRLINLAAPEALQAAVAAGLCGVGSVFAGGSEQTAKMLQEALQDQPAGGGFRRRWRAPSSRRTSRARRSFPASVIRCTSRSIRARRSCSASPSATASAAVTSRCWKRSAREAERRLQRSLPINATGAIGAILCELGFPWRICRGIAVISRAVGLVGHLAEEMRNPLAREIWERTEAEVYENKD